MNIVETKNLTKKFGDFTANDNINFTVKKGEIKAIVGENGAGKSTLMNMLYGLLEPTSGQIFIKETSVHLQSPSDAISLGIGMVHQHFKLAPSLTVSENMLLGIEIVKKGLPFLDEKKQYKKVQEVIEKYKFMLSPNDKIEDLSVGARQRVEILKMLYRDVDILILDEPTAVLTPQEVDELAINLKNLKESGKTIIIITHKLAEVMAIADSITVIRRGKVVGEINACDCNENQLAQMMVGRDVLLKVDKKDIDYQNSDIVYELDNICTENTSGKEVVSDVSLKVRKGEILGIAGIEGNGQSELVKIMTGTMESTKGKITFNNKDITNAWPRQIRDSKIGIIHEDRYVQGLCKSMTVSENIIAGYHYKADVCKNDIMQINEINKKRDRLVRDYDIRIANLYGTISQLSGGNAQKIIISREFDAKPKLLIACQPTRGVDVGSIEFIHKQILALRESGAGVVLISSELSEIMSLSDTIAVMYKGKVIGQVNTKDTNSTQIGLLMAGIKDYEQEIKGGLGDD